MEQSFVQQNMNFFEYHLWLQDKKMAEQSINGYVWKDREGFIYHAGYKPPVKTDILFLMYLLLKSQQNDWKEVIEVSRFEVLRACMKSIGKREYDRLEESLKRWKMLSLEFKGKFYDDREYQTMNFGIIDGWEIEKNRILRVYFSSRWLEKIKHSNYVKKINFHYMKMLRSPLAMRLYEILLKNFQGRKEWQIGTQKLAEKIPMEERYPADIIPKIQSAVHRIHKETELQLSLEVRRPKRGKAIFTFRKEEKVNESDSSENNTPQEMETLEKLLSLIPQGERRKKSVSNMLLENLHQHGEKYVIRNILHTNRHAKKSYTGYLWKSFKEDYGEALELEENEEMAEVEQEEEVLVLPTLSEVLGVPEEHKWQFEDLVHLVLEDYRDSTSVFEIIELGLQKRTIEEVIWSILYANQYHTNYLPSLHSSIQVNQGQFYRILLARKKMDSKS